MQRMLCFFLLEVILQYHMNILPSRKNLLVSFSKRSPLGNKGTRDMMYLAEAFCLATLFVPFFSLTSVKFVTNERNFACLLTNKKQTY